MKYLIYSDIHWSATSSLIRGRGKKYSDRIENLIEGLNWIEKCADELFNVDKVLCLGDFFNSSSVEQEEITALNDVKWSKKPHQFLVGNHESSMHDLRYNSADIMKKFGFEVINEVKEEDGVVFIPYIPSKDREPFIHYVKDKNSIVFSHNDIAGVQFGEFVTKEGFDLKEISDNCKLFLNGHIHNQGQLAHNVFNVGSTFAHNLTNDSKEYKYGIWYLDTEDPEGLDFIPNPYTFNFFKLEINEEKDIDEIKTLPLRTAVSVKSREEFVPQVKDAIKENKNILYSRVIVVRDVVEREETSGDDLSIDYMDKLIRFIHEQVGVSDIVDKELSVISEREI